MSTPSAPLPDLLEPMQSLLFVPATRPDRVRKALATEADVVCVDLEDSIPGPAKDDARATALGVLKDHASERLIVRINALTTAAGIADLLALSQNDARPPVIMIPKTESSRDIEIVASVLGNGGVRVIPLIETARGLRSAVEIVSSRGVHAAMFGGGDLSGELGVALEWTPLLVARAQFLLACAEAGVPAIDVPFVNLEDAPGLESETRQAIALGFSAKAAIHPDQIPHIHAVMRPTADELDRAREAAAAFGSGGGAAVRFHGRLLEEPLMRRYRRLLALEYRKDA